MRISETCWLKTMHNLHVEHCVLFGGSTEDLITGDNFSDNSEGLFGRGKSQETQQFAKTNQVVEHQKISIN